MSGRSASRRLRMKKGAQAVSPQTKGAAACASGQPRSANPYSGATGSRGKAHAWEKGWNNEHTKRCNAIYHGDIDGDFNY